MPAMDTAMKRAEMSADDAAKRPCRQEQQAGAEAVGDPDDPGNGKGKENYRDKGENPQIPCQSLHGNGSDRRQEQ